MSFLQKKCVLEMALEKIKDHVDAIDYKANATQNDFLRRSVATKIDAM